MKTKLIEDVKDINIKFKVAEWKEQPIHEGDEISYARPDDWYKVKYILPWGYKC